MTDDSEKIEKKERGGEKFAIVLQFEFLVLSRSAFSCCFRDCCWPLSPVSKYPLALDLTFTSNASKMSSLFDLHYHLLSDNSDLLHAQKKRRGLSDEEYLSK